MSKGAKNFSTDNEYYTPKEIVSLFGSFDYDPATTEQKAKDLGVSCYDTIETNGLLTDWTQYKKIWINPPFTNKLGFLKKAMETYLKVNNEIYFLSPVEFLTTKNFHKLIKEFGLGVKLFIPNGRIKFQSGLGKDSKSPAFGSVVFRIQNCNEIELIDITKNSNQTEMF